MSVWNDDERPIRDLWTSVSAPPTLRSRYEAERAHRRPNASLRPLLLAGAVAVVIAAAGLAFGAHRPVSLGSGQRPTAPAVPTSPASPLPSPSSTASDTPSATPSAVIAGWPSRRLTDRQAGSLALDANAVFALVAAPDTQWLSDSDVDLVRLDRSTGRVTASRHIGAATSLLRAGGEVWVGAPDQVQSPTRGTILRFDAISLAPRGSIALPRGSGASDAYQPGVRLSASGTTVVAGFGSNFEVIDATTATVRRTVAAGGQQVVEDVAISPKGRRIYAVTGDSSQTFVLSEWDAATGQPVSGGSATLDSVGPPQLTATDAGVWVSRATGMMGTYEFHPSGALATARPPGGAPSDTEAPNSVHTAFARSILWVLGSGVRCADPATGANRAVDPMASSYTNSLVADGAVVFVSDSSGIALLTPPPACSR
jgi:hypothetical protein